MAMMANVDFDTYRGRPRMDSVSGVLLGKRLIKAAPEERSERLTRRLEGVRATTQQAQDVRKRRSRHRPENLRPYDQRVDNGWGGLYTVINGQVRFEGEDVAEVAQRLKERLFPNGAEFLTISYEAEWLHGETLLARIDEEEGLAADIRAVAGKHALPYIRVAQQEMADALGVGDTDVEIADTKAMAEALDALASAVAAYTRVLAGETDEDDADSVARWRKAVAPLDQHRAYHAKKASSGGGTEPETDVTEEDGPIEDDVDVDGPVPPLPEPPAA